jgi:hypothetical protein
MVTLGALSLAELDGNAGPAATAAATTTEIKKSVFAEETIILRSPCQPVVPQVAVPR